MRIHSQRRNCKGITIVQDVDFGPFSISGYFDSYAYYMPVMAPVVASAISGYNLIITIRFIGPNDQLLGEFLIEDIVPFGYGDQYIENFVTGLGSVSTDSETWGGVKSLFR